MLKGTDDVGILVKEARFTASRGKYPCGASFCPVFVSCASKIVVDVTLGRCLLFLINVIYYCTVFAASRGRWNVSLLDK